jgi:glycine/D-amino acid oxidase-like deaminating enzyme
MEHSSKIVIIGAGVFGLTTAKQLALEGHQNITVLDRHMPPVRSLIYTHQNSINSNHHRFLMAQALTSPE